MSDRYCNHGWRAPRADVPASTDVNHVCALPLDHDHDHRCSCGAEGSQRPDPLELQQAAQDLADLGNTEIRLYAPDGHEMTRATPTVLPPIDPPAPPWIKQVLIARVDGSEVLVDATDVDGWLTAYLLDDNTFWRSDSGHHQNVIDDLIDYAQRLRTELAKHGWGDFHYTPQGAPQDPAIVALLAEYPALGAP